MKKECIWGLQFVLIHSASYSVPVKKMLDSLGILACRRDRIGEQNSVVGNLGEDN